MQDERHWLPEPALDGGVLAALLTGVVRDWSADWFAQGRLRPVDLSSAQAMAGIGQGFWLDSGGGVALAVPVPDALAGMLLGVDVPEQRTSSDRRIVAALVRDGLDDLGRRLIAPFGLPADTRWTVPGGGGMPDLVAPRCLGLQGANAAPVLRLCFSTDRAAMLRRSGLPPAVPITALQPIATALAAQSIAVAAALGRCTLSVAEINGLGIGDVLVFDTALDAPLALAIDGHAIMPAMWRVEQSGDRLDLKLLEPIDGQS